MDEILCMDPWHVQNIILHPRDKNRNLILSEKGRPDQPASMEEYVKKSFEQFDLPPWQLAKLVREWFQTAEEMRRKATTNCTITGM